MELFQQTFAMFKPLGLRPATTETDKPAEPVVAEEHDIDDLRRQMKDMQDRLDRMSKDPKTEE